MFIQRKSLKNVFGHNALVGSCLIPEMIVRSELDRVADVLFCIRGRSADGTVLVGHLVAGGQVSNTLINNSVNPAWRTALFNVFSTQRWSAEPLEDSRELMAARVRSQIDQEISGSEWFIYL